jgi:hypothetical protein
MSNSAKDNELQRNLDFFINNQAILSTQYKGKILLIYHQQVTGSFENYEKAYTEALSKYIPGEFSLIPCRPGPDAYTVGFSNLAHFAKPADV